MARMVVWRWISRLAAFASILRPLSALTGAFTMTSMMAMAASPQTCDDAVVAGDKVHNAKWASAEDTATNLAEVEIARPFCTDEST